jgi:hypothetical protein
MAVLTAAVVLPAATAGAAEPEDATSTVTVVHGIPGSDLGLDPALPVDVLVNGTICALTDLRFEDISPRLELPAGTYDVEVKLSDGSCGGATAIEAEDIELPAGVNATVVANLDADGAPTLSVFLNDLSPTAPYQARVAVHHTAAAPAVDVSLTYTYDGRWTFPFIALDGVTNGQQGVADTWVGPYDAQIAPAGGDPIFSAPVTLDGGVYYAVYAVGSVSTGTFTLIVDAQPTQGSSHS